MLVFIVNSVVDRGRSLGNTRDPKCQLHVQRVWARDSHGRKEPEIGESFRTSVPDHLE